jgi:hypothetical protein
VSEIEFVHRRPARHSRPSMDVMSPDASDLGHAARLFTAVPRITRATIGLSAFCAVWQPICEDARRFEAELLRFAKSRGWQLASREER